MTRLIDADALKKENERLLHCDFPYLSEITLEELIDDAPTIDAEPHWIPCSERLPEAPFGCLVTVEDEEPMTGALFPNLLPYFVGWDGEQWNDADGEQCPFEVLAWMPLPDPYEVEK